MVLLGFPKLSGWNDFGRDGLWKLTRGVEDGFGFFGGNFLLRRVIKNHGAVLGADIRALAIYACRVVNLPEFFKKGFIGDDCGIIFYQQGFGMACCIGADIRVGWVL